MVTEYQREVFSLPMKRENGKGKGKRKGEGEAAAERVSRKIFFLLVQSVKNPELLTDEIKSQLSSMVIESSTGFRYMSASAMLLL